MEDQEYYNWMMKDTALQLIQAVLIYVVTLTLYWKFIA